MANATEYELAASRFRQLGENCQRQAALVAAWRLDSELGVGPIADIVSVRLRASSDQFAVSGGEFTRLARVCDQRAVICAEYRRRVTDYFRLPDLVRAVTPAPIRPYSWVDL